MAAEIHTKGKIILYEKNNERVCVQIVGKKKRLGDDPKALQREREKREEDLYPNQPNKTDQILLQFSQCSR